MMRAAVVEHDVDSDFCGGDGVVEAVPDHDRVPDLHVPRVQEGEMTAEMRSLRLAGFPGVPVDAGHVFGHSEPPGHRHELVVPPHRQQRLGMARLGDTVESRPGIVREVAVVEQAPVDVVEGAIDPLPLLLRHRSIEQARVEQVNGSRVVIAIVVGRDRAGVEPLEGGVDALHDDGEIVEQRPVPVPDDVRHRIQETTQRARMPPRSPRVPSR